MSGKAITQRRMRSGATIAITGVVIYLLAGLVLLGKLPFAMTDFRVLYFSARALTQHSDPYSVDEMQKLFHASPQFNVEGYPGVQLVIERYVYPPMTFAFTAPLALLPIGIAKIVWIVTGNLAFLLSVYLIFIVGSRRSPEWAGVLCALLVAGSAWLFMIGNAALVSTGLCVIAVYTLVERRWEWVGVVLLAVSLIFKPHCAGPIWLFFLLATPIFRKRALEALAVVVLMCAPAILWTSHVSPHWLSEERGNVAYFAGHGHYDDPGPNSGIGHDIDPAVNLQSIVSIVVSTATTYNGITYAICGVLLLIWIAATLRMQATGENTWLGLACIAAMAMLPLHHRQHDARQILLCIPACLSLWVEGRRLGVWAIGLTTAGFFLLGDLGTALRIGLIEPWLKLQTGLFGAIVTIFLGRPAQLSLLILTLLFLWVYCRRAWGYAGTTTP